MKDSRKDEIQKAIDGGLSDEAFEKFQRDALADPELLKEYANAVTLHADLNAMQDELADLDESSVEFPGKTSWISPWAAIAAAVVAAAVTWVFTKSDIPVSEAVATLAEADGARWAGSELPTAEGSRLPAGTLALVEGMATLEFDSGATVTMEAPATVVVTDEMRCRLVEGSVVADVPESAHGFTIDAPDLEVIDLGTRFGITANQFGGSHVMVFEGEVEVKKSGDENAKLVEEGGTFLNGSKAVATDQEMMNHAVVETVSENGDGWISISTGVGSGKDSFVRRDHRTPAGDQPLMMVKHTELAERNERRGIITFDVRNIATDSVDAVELVLDVEPSGLGFSTLVPNSKFAVYAVRDNSLDSWREDSVVWENAPALNDAGVLPEKTLRVGEFEIMRGASASAQVRVSSPELTHFLREDANGLATFLIVRLTGETESQGLVHAFATKEHPNAKAPTLRMRLK